MAILAIHTDCFKLLILAISCKNLGDEYPDTMTAPDPFVARDLIVERKPDVITLDREAETQSPRPGEGHAGAAAADRGHHGDVVIAI
jgi:hypothetical protein